ncbi:hypothetical protein GIB67_007948 [Kingdonia uniflora]|uniref:Aminotransferase-like plant mobile domain-containing protein n=1 Tax=Kingdonia uniflora TaxID=39325 RepID=A0A7J7LIV9_9MAGN|nr:hypothetical protein GIB67_007948 [Kingdonia uniflora]
MAPKQKVSKKIHPTASHRKRLIEEREDPSHSNFNQPPRVSAKRSRTDSIRLEESRSIPQVAVTPEEVQDVESPSTSRGDSQTTVSSTDFVYPNVFYLLKSWIFEHFPKLLGIPKPNDSRAPEYNTRWSWSRTTSDRSGVKALKTFREALDNYKLEDVVWDTYLEKRADRHVFKKVASFTSFIHSLENIKAYYHDRVQRQFSRRQYVPRNPICLDTSSLCFAVEPSAYKPKYEWADLFSGRK